MNNNLIEELQLQIQDNTQEVRKVVRRIDDMEKTVTLINEDRSILEDLRGDVIHLKEIVVAGREKTIDKVTTAVEKEAAVTRFSLIDDVKKHFNRKNIEPKRKWWKFYLK